MQKSNTNPNQNQLKSNRNQAKSNQNPSERKPTEIQSEIQAEIQAESVKASQTEASQAKPKP